ncbi:MAG: trehalose-phosphatase [Deltaproteobacteria bacterium]|nr:trehalose-phosphatase [Deltaproteobacteria bacterium]
MRDHWLQLARHSPLGIVLDLDGTLVPFAPTPAEARPGPELLEQLDGLAAMPGVILVVASGRGRADLDAMFAGSERTCLFAEHGGWRRDRSGWQPSADVVTPSGIDELASALESVAAGHPGSLVERKDHALAIHARAVAAPGKAAWRGDVEAVLGPWLAAHPGHSRLDGAEVIEVRPSWMRKSLAVDWLRRRAAADLRIVALGDDVTDEDTFGALGLADEAVRVGPGAGRETEARWSLVGPAEAVAFLAWLAAVRGGAEPPPAALPVSLRQAPCVDDCRPSRFDLLAVSNRLPNLRSPTLPRDERRRNVGGLVAALEPALAARRGLWLGWSGRDAEGGSPGAVRLDEESRPAMAWVDFPREWHDRYYNGFCNRVLWPLLHTFPSRVQFFDEDWEAYRRANQAFAAAAFELVGADTPIWVHDYHLLLVARGLRRLGHRGPVGLFLHVPFPGPDVFDLVPWAEQLLDGMLDFDLLGFHTPGYAENFLQCAGRLIPSDVVGGELVHRGHRVRVGSFPIGIIPESFQDAPEPDEPDDIEELFGAIAPARLVLGVDRLDYTKGIPERLHAFGRLLERYPEWRGRACLVQVSVPSREDVPEYAEQRKLVELAVSRINGDFSDGRWIPVRYQYRSYRPHQLARLYRAAHVGYVTPLRDGMNLVAKEYVAAQDPADPGVLLLSRFAGAAVELRDAVLTNPWHVGGMAGDLDRALRMPREERVERHGRLARVVERSNAISWARDFICALEACRTDG